MVNYAQVKGRMRENQKRLQEMGLIESYKTFNETLRCNELTLPITRQIET